MMAIQDMRSLTEVIERTYKSLEKPDFSFVSKAISLRPYDLVIQQIQGLFEIEQITDSNDDVSFRYLLSKSKQQWVVELSMLGRYAAVLSSSDTGSVGLVTLNSSVEEERQILSFLLKNKFEVLEQQELEKSFPLRLFNAEPENVCIYQALFSDTDVLPWKG